MSATPKKRRPGGGRKATLHKVSTFSTRITEETRRALEAESTKSGISISQLAERLLKEGLQERRDRSFVGRPVNALAILIESLEHGSRAYAADGVREWNSDPTVFEVLRIAIAKLLEKLRPPGDIDTSIDGPLIGRTPEERAEAIFRQVWVDLLTARPVSSTEMAEYYGHYDSLYGPPSQELLATYAEVSRRSDRAIHVRNVLNIKGKESEK